MANVHKVSRVQKRGQVTIPIEIRQQMGLEEGDLVAFVETPQGVVLSPQEVVPAQTLEQKEASSEGSQRTKGANLSDLFTFADRLANGAPEQDATREGQSIAEQTAGIFAAPDRGPLDLAAARQEFVEETARRINTENSREDK